MPEAAVHEYGHLLPREHHVWTNTDAVGMHTEIHSKPSSPAVQLRAQRHLRSGIALLVLAHPIADGFV